MKRRWLLWILIIIFVWIVVTRLTEIQKLAETLAQGRWQWVLAAALIQLVYYVAWSSLYQAAFATVEVRSRLRDLLPVVMASVFVNVAAPTSGASGVALFVDDAARRGESPARAAAGTVLVMVADFAAFMPLLFSGLIYLFLEHHLQYYEIIGAALMVLLLGGLTGVLLLGLWRPGLLSKLLGWAQRLVNRLGALIKRPQLLEETWATRNATEFTEAAMAIAAHPSRLGRTLGIALAMHLLDLTSLYVLFLAFNQPLGFGALMAGYAMGILFWIVSPTPQGVGIVEGVMALVYTTLGVPAAKATVVSLAFRGLTFWLPLLIGFLLLRRVKSFGAGERARSQSWSVRAISLLVAMMGLVNLFSAVTPALAGRLELIRRLVPSSTRHGAHLATALAGFALLLLARNLSRRKRLAWLLTLLILIFSALTHMLNRLDYEVAVLALAVAAWLWLLRGHFHARSDAPSVRQGLGALAAALGFTLVYGALGFYLLDQHFRVHYDVGAAIQQTVIMFTQFYDPGLEPLTGFGRYFAVSIYAVAAITVGWAFLMIFRPVLVRHSATPEECARAKTIVEAYGRSSLAFFALSEDKSYWFSPGGSVIAFVVRGEIALTLGDPIGPPHDAAAAIQGFQAHATRNGWLPTFYQILPDYLDLYRTAGLDVLSMGHEAIVPLERFTLAGDAHKGLRSALNKLSRLGYTATLHQPPLAESLLAELRDVSDEWLTMVHGAEKRFSLGWFDDAYIRACPVMTVNDPKGMVAAFANLVPEYQLNEATIDLMRRRRGMEHGINDLLFVSLFQWAREQGYATFNLGLCALSGVGERSGDPTAERALHYIYEHLGRFYNYKGLHAYKSKFDPLWSPRYLVYPGTASLPAVAIAIIRADSGDSLWEYFRR